MKLIIGFLNNIVNTVHSIYKIIKHSSIRIRFIKYENRQANCLILGNGPSLVSDIQRHGVLMDNSDLVVVNNFSTSDLFEVYKPKYYVIADPAFNKSTNNKKLQEKIDVTFEMLIKKTNWDLMLFFPYRISPILRKLLQQNTLVKICEYNTLDIKGFTFFRYLCYKRNWGMPRPQNVLIASIFIALNLGYKRIYLLGADHSWLNNIEVDFNNRVCLSDYHFYDKDSTNISLTPWLKNNSEVFTMPEILRTLALTFDGYFELKSYANFINSQIFNYSKISYIDAFNRKEDL